MCKPPLLSYHLRIMGIKGTECEGLDWGQETEDTPGFGSDGASMTIVVAWELAMVLGIRWWQSGSFI